MERWHDWEVKELIGEGSFARVYRIERTAFGHTYEAALKVIRIPANQSEFNNAISEGMSEEEAKAYFRDMAEAFSNEFAFMSELKGNSNIVSFEDFEVVPDEDGYSWEVFIRMELLEPFTSKLKDAGVSEEEAVELGIDMCRALELCEQKNIIHRDIKPANIFISPQGTYKLGDFGIARELEKTSAGLSKKGTYSYMAPEIYRGEQYGPNADIYSLGMVLYRLLNNNRLPFLPEYPAKIKYTDTEEATRRRLAGEPLPAPACAGEELGRIILKACAFDPADRYRRAAEMRKDLEAYRAATENDDDNEKTVAVVTAPVSAQAGPEPVETVPEAAPEEPKPVQLASKPVEAAPESAPEEPKPAEAAAKAGAAGKAEDVREEARVDEKEKRAKIKEKKRKPEGNKTPLKYKVIIAAAVAAFAVIIFAVSGGMDPYREDDRVHIYDKEITEGMMNVITHDPRVEFIYFNNCKISDEVMQKLGKKKGVTSVDIEGCTGFTSFDPLAEMDAEDMTLSGGSGDDGEHPVIDGLISKDFKDRRQVTLSNWKTEDGGSVIKRFNGTKSVNLHKITGDIDMNNVADNSALVFLYISECNAEAGDFSPLGKCTGIRTIEVTGCGVTEISWMKPMTELENTTLSNNRITSLSGLENHIKLSSVEAEDNQLTELSGLSGCSDLSTLRLNNNGITDISGLSGCSSLHTLEIADSEVSDISALKGCPELRWLDATNNKIADISPLSGCEKMTHLYLNNNSAGNLDACDRMIDLEIVHAANNKINDIGGLSNTTQLQDVDLTGNEIGDISALGKNQEKLEQVKLSGNGIKDISALSGCTELKMVSIGNNQIKDISALAGTSHLVYLAAGRNEISDITSLTESVLLTYTDLGDNQIKDISPLGIHNAPNQILMLQNNQISDISVLPASVSFNLLSLYGNPVGDVSRLGEFDNVNRFSCYLYLPWKDGADYSPLARTDYQRITMVDTPADKMAALKSDREKIRKEEGLYTMADEDYTFRTKEEADADMEAVRREARAQENIIGPGLSMDAILGG